MQRPGLLTAEAEVQTRRYFQTLIPSFSVRENRDGTKTNSISEPTFSYPPGIMTAVQTALPLPPLWLAVIREAEPFMKASAAEQIRRRGSHTAVDNAPSLPIGAVQTSCPLPQHLLHYKQREPSSHDHGSQRGGQACQSVRSPVANWEE